MHPEVRQKNPGKCPKCGGMELVKEGESGAHTSKAGIKDYFPLIVIVGLIFTTSVLISLDSFSTENLMRYFMAGFFIVFAVFKLMDLKGFKQGYQTYDLLAKKIPNYGYIYPFLELGIGFLYILNIFPLQTNLFTFILMTFSGLGVAINIAQKKKFQCACLGTFIKVPLTKVTLIEDFGMALMALFMLI